MNPSIPFGKCFDCGHATNETNSRFGVGHYQCFLKAKVPLEEWIEQRAEWISMQISNSFSHGRTEQARIFSA